MYTAPGPALARKKVNALAIMRWERKIQDRSALTLDHLLTLRAESANWPEVAIKLGMTYENLRTTLHDRRKMSQEAGHGVDHFHRNRLREGYTLEVLEGMYEQAGDWSSVANRLGMKVKSFYQFLLKRRQTARLQGKTPKRFYRSH